MNEDNIDPIEVVEDLNVEEYFESICLTRKQNDDCSDNNDITLPF
mgnify:FL=1